MNKLFFLSIVVIYFFTGKLTAQNDSTHYFVVLYTVGESWDTTMQFHQQKYFNEHSNFLSKLRKEKTIVAGGRYADTGMIILKAANEKTAYLIMDSDISVVNKIFKFELHPLDVFYAGCLDESPNPK